MCLLIPVNFNSSFRHEGLILLFGKAGRVVVGGKVVYFGTGKGKKWTWKYRTQIII